jgi:HTH-type transcriptional regulator / antitoxin HigA
MVAELRSIRSEAEYEVAMAELERLWGAASGTPDGDRLDILATLLDVYENEHDPMDPPDPAEPVNAASARHQRSSRVCQGWI